MNCIRTWQSYPHNQDCARDARRASLARLFVSEGLNRVETRCLPGRPEPESDAESDRYYKPDKWSPERDKRRQKHDSDNLGCNPAQQDSEHTPKAGERRCFNEELKNNVAPSRADGLSHTDLARTLSD